MKTKTDEDTKILLEEVAEKYESELKKIEKSLEVLKKSENPFETFRKHDEDPFSEIKLLIENHELFEVEDEEEYKEKIQELKSKTSNLKEQFQILVKGNFAHFVKFKGENFFIDEKFTLEEKNLEELTDKEWIQVGHLLFVEPDLLEKEPLNSFELDCQV
jgi:hypothetical protein